MDIRKDVARSSVFYFLILYPLSSELKLKKEKLYNYVPWDKFRGINFDKFHGNGFGIHTIISSSVKGLSCGESLVRDRIPTGYLLSAIYAFTGSFLSSVCMFALSTVRVRKRANYVCMRKETKVHTNI